MNLHAYTCTICLEPTECYEGPKSKYILPRHAVHTCILKCKHVFHKKCIHKWITHALSDSNDVCCPCCREEIFVKQPPEYVIIDDEIVDGYIYYDNAGIQLFITDIKQNRLHYCTGFIVEK